MGHVAEEDLVNRIWCFTRESYSMSGVDVVNCGVSYASSVRKNCDRVLTGIKKLDMSLIYNNLELSSTEAGREDHGPNSTKELVEGCCKIPKMLRDMIVIFAKKHPGSRHCVVLVGHIMSGLSTTTILMDSPKDQVCRYRSVDRLDYPTSIED